LVGGGLVLGPKELEGKDGKADGSAEPSKEGKSDGIAELTIEGLSLGAKEGPSEGIVESTLI